MTKLVVFPLRESAHSHLPQSPIKKIIFLSKTIDFFLFFAYNIISPLGHLLGHHRSGLFIFSDIFEYNDDADVSNSSVNI